MRHARTSATAVVLGPGKVSRTHGGLVVVLLLVLVLAVVSVAVLVVVLVLVRLLLVHICLHCMHSSCSLSIAVCPTF